MKATRYILAAALTVIAAASCQKENTPDNASEVIINATIENTDTKTVLGEGYTGTDGKVHHKVLWYNNESISLFDSNSKNHRFTAYNAKSTESAEFRHNTGDGYGTLADLTISDKVYSVYPANPSHSFALDTKILTYKNLSTTQTAVLNGFSDELAVAVGIGETTYTKDDATYINMSFTNATALAKIEIVGSGVKQITLLNKVSRKIGGQFTIDLSSETMIFSAGSADRIHLNNFTSIKNDETEKTTYTANNLEEGVYYIALIPGAFRPRIRIYSGDFTPTSSYINDSSYTYDGSGSTEVDLKPGMILDLGKFNSSGRVTE